MAAWLFFLSGVALVLALLWLKSHLLDFRAQRPADLATKGPLFDIRVALQGPMLCEGVIYGPFGRVTSRFVADMQATWQGNVGTMTEEFRYDSGARQSRCWRLTLAEDGTITARAPDVVGQGRGQQSGAGVVLRYRIRLGEDAGGHVLDATDWMYMLENGSILNRSQFHKFGIKVAELVATLRKVAP